MKAPRLTVLMSVHNGGRWLHAAVESVLAQSWTDFEFLIIDDASSDDTAAQVEAVGDARIRLIRLTENIGLTRSLNRGLQEARGELVARHDADDLSEPTRFATQNAFLDTHLEVALVGTQAWLIDAEGRSRGRRNLPCEPIALRWLSLLDNPIIHTAAMFRTAIVRDELGGYDESYPCCQDYALWSRVAQKHPIANLPERLVRVREHDGSISATRQTEAREMVRRVVQQLADAWLPSLALDDAAIQLLCAFRRHPKPAEIRPFHELLGRVEQEFATRFPEAASSRDLQRTRADVFARIAYNLVSADRSLALGELRRALASDPAVGVRFPWIRFAALLALGGRARQVFERLRG